MNFEVKYYAYSVTLKPDVFKTVHIVHDATKGEVEAVLDLEECWLTPTKCHIFQQTVVEYYTYGYGDMVQACPIGILNNHQPYRPIPRGGVRVSGSAGFRTSGPGKVTVTGTLR